MKSSSTFLPALLPALAAFYLPFVSVGTAFADVALFLTDGRQLVADRIGPETDRQGFALRSEREGITVTRLVPWREIQEGRIEGRTYSREELKIAFADAGLGSKPASTAGLERGGQFTSLPEQPVPSVPAEAAPPPARVGTFEGKPTPVKTAAPGLCCDLHPHLPLDARVLGIRDDPLSAYQNSLDLFFPHGVPLSEAGFTLDLMRAEKAKAVLGVEGRPRDEPTDLPPMPHPTGTFPFEPIQFIAADASPISAHGKVDWDSLAVEVRAVDRGGYVRPLRGTLRITLRGQSQQLVQGYGNRLLGEAGRVEKIATWTRSIDTTRGQASQPVRLVLPLPRPLPDHDLRRAPFGELHVQLLAPGEGTFETIQRNILLRHASLLRDRHLLETGSRFFADEGTHDSVRRSRPAGRRSGR